MESSGIKKAIILCFSILVINLLFFIVAQLCLVSPGSGGSALPFFTGLWPASFVVAFKREALHFYREHSPFWFAGFSLLNLSFHTFLLRSPSKKESDAPLANAVEIVGLLAFGLVALFLASSQRAFVPGILFSPQNESLLFRWVVYFFVFFALGQNLDPADKTFFQRLLVIDGIGTLLLLFRIPMVGILLLAGNLCLFLVRSFRSSSIWLTIGYAAVLSGLVFDGWHVYRSIPSPIGFFILGVLVYLFFLFLELLQASKRETAALKARIDALQAEKTIQRLLLQEKEEEARKDSEALKTFEQLILTTNALYEKALLVKEDYLHELLEHARLLIPEADGGMLVLAENGGWRSHFSLGAVPQSLKRDPIDPSVFHVLKTHTATRFYDANVFLTTAHVVNPSRAPHSDPGGFGDTEGSFLEALLAEITGAGSTIGYLLLFTSESKQKRFTPTSYKVIGVLGSIASILLASTLKKQ